MDRFVGKADAKNAGDHYTYLYILLPIGSRGARDPCPHSVDLNVLPKCDRSAPSIIAF
jgi:hypothetical protein